MRGLRIFALVVIVGLIICGCRKDKRDTETAETRQPEQKRKDSAMGTTIQWLGHASFRISHDDTVIYIDPWKLKNEPNDATMVLVSHNTVGPHVLASVIMAKPGIYSPKDYRNIRVHFFCEADDLSDARIPVCHKRGYENGRRLSDLD